MTVLKLSTRSGKNRWGNIPDSLWGGKFLSALIGAQDGANERTFIFHPTKKGPKVGELLIPDVVFAVGLGFGEVEGPGADVDILVELGETADVAFQVLPLVPVEAGADLIK